MAISILTELEYDLSGPADILLQIEAAMIPEQVVTNHHIQLPPVEHFARVPGQSMIGERIWLRTDRPLQVRYEATVEANRILADIASLPQTPPHQLPGETVDYLMASRFCPADEFQQFVEGEFPGTSGGARIAAIRDWIAGSVAYTPGASNPQTTATDTFHSHQGVCRDYAHLMIALARASAVPARFASVYGLGVEPQDFHAVAEVFLDGCWHIVDATGMADPATIAKIGVGRDAADVAFLTSYGQLELRSQRVSVQEVVAA